ncbi:MAG: DUF1016 domain-containing protein [Saprospiraceae bacterium]|nr:MAG: DUF1016 domain-containing protein [Saprospiraceae bacterium]
MELTNKQYDHLVEQISVTYEAGLRKVAVVANQTMLATYWQIGQYIVEFEQEGREKATYGTALLKRLSADLTLRHGRGFSHTNINYMRLFYLRYPILETVSPKLSWGLIFELLKIDDPLERGFYEKQAVRENWHVRELKRQKKSMLFHRLALSRDKEGILELSQRGQSLEKPEDLLREPYVLDFLKIPEPYHFSESELEERIIVQLRQFLLELGKGFAFVGQQYRVPLGNRDYRVDLVFYHRILKCFVLIDLKKGEADYADVGQMNMYLGYFEEEENTEGDNPPIGIVLAREKDEMVVRYAMKNLNSNLFVTKYQLYLPNREELQKKLEEILGQEEEEE